MTYDFTARVKTLEGNYVAICNNGYGDYIILWLHPDMETIIRQGEIEEWLWATSSWEQPMEKGYWELPVETLHKHIETITKWYEGKKEIAYKYFKPEMAFDENCTPEAVAKFGSYTEKDFVEKSYSVYEKIKALPSGLEFIEIEGDTNYNKDGYGYTTYPAKIEEYTGKKPVIVITEKYETWRGGSSRGRKNFYLVENGKEPELIITQVQGDGFGIVKSSNNNFDFKELYTLLH